MKRYLIAFLIMMVGIGYSWFFLRPSEWSQTGSRNREAIARIDRIFNEANRQLEGRLMWEPVKPGELVYLGDKIKTSPLSSVTLTFLKQNSKLEIEENSTVKVEGIDQRVTLNMLEGRVFLKMEEQKEADQLNVISAGKKLDVKGSVAVSVNQDGSSQVIDFKTDTTDPFSDLLPEYGVELLQNSNEYEVTWEPRGKGGVVFVETGDSVSRLVRQQESVPYQGGKISLPLKPGINYWRLVTLVDNQEAASSLMRLTLRRPVPPSLLNPSKEEILNLKDQKIEFRWTLGNVGKEFLFELGKDPSMKEKLETIEISGQTFLTLNRQLAEGQYFWRVRSRGDEKNEWLDEGAQSFKVTYSELLLSPGLLAPLDETSLYLGSEGTVSVNLSWKKQDNIKFYELLISGPEYSKKLKLDSETVKITLPKAGTYSWSVVSQAKDGRDSVSPIRWQFFVKQREQVKWKSDSKIYTYLENLPIVILEWEKTSYKSFLLKVSRRPDLSQAESFQISNRDFPYRPAEDGFYYAQVQGLDEEAQIAGVSDVYEFKVEKAPLPPTPILVDSTILASSKGEFITRAKNFQKGWRLFSQLINVKGVIVDEREFLEENLKYKGLLPGAYVLHLTYVDSYGRKSRDASRVEVKVPEKSLISAPKIKGIKIR